ncbi:8a642c71-02e4-4acf-b4ee-2291641d0938 [Thermothielavioides terrestris]|uniref:8a642c71-02e4-4acf-b4ee-2291641d0938 n=1 Tax=Thermothielavioides terrestris TaxID=2587410 RepID=A0A3S4F2X8_9PEZI|nr:8a642c71-02e4-4acf-b4ee-2291641d0938 [Thermothielavioides terrestris]
MQHPWNLGLSEEVDAAWEDLLYALNIRISEDEMSILHENRTHRVRVNGGDYVGVLGVYHHMHCLYNLRRVVHWDYYDHCIDSIRQALMCHTNTALYTAEWVKDSHDPFNKELRSSAA